MREKRRLVKVTGLALPILLALVCIAAVLRGSSQASLPVPMPQEFVGEYSYDGETWHTLTETSPISALNGDLTVRGRFAREIPAGGMLTFYRDHIGVSVYINGERAFADAVSANRDLPPRVFASMCVREWIYFICPGITAEDQVEIRLTNVHRYGNSGAYRTFLNSLCVDSPEWALVQENLEPYGTPFRVLGGMFAIIALVLFGAALAAAALHVPIGGNLLLLGLLMLFAGGAIVFDAVDSSYWIGLNVLNTYAGQLCTMLAVLCLAYYVCQAMTGKKERAARIAVLLSALFDSVIIFLSFTGAAVIFDMLLWWAAFQLLLCPLLFALCGASLPAAGKKARLTLVSGMLMFAAVVLDIAGVGGNIIWRNPCSKTVFSVLVAIHIVVGAGEVVKNHRASVRAQRLEKELEDSRISIMLSQIKPHFLYNVLNTIYHLYRKEPETAQEAVSSFAEYLRCNMLSIEKNELIPFAEEYRHIQTYLSLEQIRFRGKVDVVYDVEVTDFRLPPLTVEPLVENAVKHGVTKKRGGGTVTVSTRRTAQGYTVTVADTGVGFDPEHYMQDGKPHIGIRNVRERLEKMSGGTLDIVSTENGTAAVITVPAKEADIRDEDHCSG